jgi:hypothetical protein
MKRAIMDWLDQQYRFLMLGAMVVELILLGWLVVVETWRR